MTVVPRLTQLLNEAFTRLPAKQQAVARVLAERPSSIAFSSAAEVATLAGVDTATVVRTCQSLGYSGWRELQAEVQGSLAARPTFAERVATLGQPDGDLTARIFEVAQSNVSQTLRDLDRAAFDAATAAIARASLVVVAAGGVSAGPGEFLTSSLQIVGKAAVLTSGAGDAAPALAPLRRGDVVVGISVWRYLRATVQTMRHAAENGATTIAITDSSVAPAALLASHTLVAHTDTVGPRLGVTGVVALIEALVARVALLDPARSQAAAAVASGLYHDDNVLGDRESRPDRQQAWDQRLSGEAKGV